jgi:Tfp pilus assembly protein PilP
MRTSPVRTAVFTIVSIVGLLLGAPGLAAQTPPAERPPAQTAPGAKPSAQTPPAQTPPGQPAPQPPATPTYSYNAEGRRDPFVSLLGRGTDPRTEANRPAGVAGILINEVSLKGIVKDHNGFFAMIQGPDNKTYIIRPGDKLLDGSVKTIVPDAVVFSQDVNDPLSLVKQKEIRKTLRSSEETRG